MQVFETAAAMRAARKAMKPPVALVPTLGGLHAGHEALLKEARARAKTVIASLFLNPTQFGPGEDLDRYPADRERDLEVMRRNGADAVFAPAVGEVYPPGEEFTVRPGAIGDVLEGATRPGHLHGVATVVAKLFIATRPDIACFGEKDAQQLELVRRMARDLLFGIEIVPVPTVRDQRGLALSSRHAYLSDTERTAATVIYRALCHAREAWLDGERAVSRLESAMRTVVEREPLTTLDYATVVDPSSFTPGATAVFPRDGEALALIAVKIGATRLIDNIRLDADQAPRGLPIP